MAKHSPARDPLIGKRVRINEDAKDIFGGDHMWAGLYGEVAQQTGGAGQYSIAIGDKIKNFPMDDFKVVEDATGQHHSALVSLPPSSAINSLTNPRRRTGLTVESIAAMGASLKVHGQAQAILVRPIPPSRMEGTSHLSPRPVYEIIAGERRWRGAIIAGLETIDMMVRDVSDEAMVELQLIENIEREDLDPMDEAEGFALLRSKLGYTVEQIAERIGKGKGESYVRKTMKLLDLSAYAREAMDEGKLGRSTGLLVARYPEDTQPEVVDFIVSLAVNGEPAPFRQVSPLVFTRFNLALATAVFDIKDDTLVIGVGSCMSCPKRSGAQDDIFGDPNSPDNCTDADCFSTKLMAHVARTREAAQREGIKVIDGDEARRAKPTPHSTTIQGFVRLSDTAFIREDCDDGKEREVTYEDALRSMGKKAPKPRLFIDPHTGASEKVITLELANKLTPDEPPPEEKTKRTSTPREDKTPPEIKALRDPMVRRALMIRLFDAIRTGQRTLGEMRLIAACLFMEASEDDTLPHTERYLGWEADLEDQDLADASRIIGEKLDAMNADQLGQAIAMAAVETAITSWAIATEEGSLDIVKSYGLDILAVRDKVAEDLARQDAKQAEAEAT
jgi:ParB/RepB/Spo0J family partition protein